MGDTATTKRVPTIKPGDIVLAGGSWWVVQEKHGQRISGALLVNKASCRNFTSRQVDRVFREMGRRV